MTQVVPRRCSGLLGALLALIGTAGAGAPGAALRQGPDAFARGVAASASLSNEQELERCASELARMPGALVSYFAIASAGGLSGSDGDWIPLDPGQMQLLGRTAALFDSSAVVNHVRNGLAATPSEPWRRIALALIGQHGGSSQLSLLAQLALDGTEAPPRPGLVEPFTRALAAVLRQEGARPRELSWLAGEAPTLRESIVRAVGQAGDPDGLEWLTTLLEDPLVGAAALQEIGRLAKVASGDLAARVVAAVHPILLTKDDARRRCAIRALNGLKQPASVPRLIQHLERTGTAGEREMTLFALRKISGVNLPEDAAAWRDWFQREQRWLQDSRQATLAKLSSEDDAQVVAAVHELSQHTLHRDRIAEPLASLLSSHRSPCVRAQICLALGRLGSEQPLAQLAAALEDDDPDVRSNASKALTAITGLSLGSDRWEWEEVLFSRATDVASRPP